MFKLRSISILYLFFAEISYFAENIGWCIHLKGCRGISNFSISKTCILTEITIKIYYINKAITAISKEAEKMIGTPVYEKARHA